MKKSKLDGPVRTLRIAVSHKDKDHPGSAVAFHGPAFDSAWRTVASQVKGCDPDDIDLEAHAREHLERAKQEFPAKDGWRVALHHVDHNDDWTEVA